MFNIYILDLRKKWLDYVAISDEDSITDTSGGTRSSV